MVAQIENIRAVEELEKIFKVPGLDAILIGPYDLSGSLGIPGEFDHPDLLEALSQIKNVSKKMNALGGIHIVEPDKGLLQQAITEGQKFIAYSVDTRMLDNTSRKALKIER